MHPLITAFAVVAIIAPCLATSATFDACMSPYVAIRLPPSKFTPSTQPPFDTPPPYWIWGNWKMRYTSRPQYHQIANIQPDHYGIMPNDTSPYGFQTDLTSYNTLNLSDNKVYTAFGYDHPRPDVGPLAFLFTGTGLLKIDTYWELLGWGYDKDGIAFRVEYEYQQPSQGYPPSINFSSREETGLADNSTTYIELRRQLAALFHGHDELSALLKNVTATVIDGRRTGQPPVDCGKACIENLDLATSS